MPEKYSPIIWNDIRVETNFLGAQRHFHWWPYYVGDKAKFRVKITRLNEKSPLLSEVGIWENLPQYMNPAFLSGIERLSGDNTIEVDCSKFSKQIEGSGNVSYYIGHYNRFEDARQIISEDAEHRGRRNLNFILFVVMPLVGVFLTLLGAWLIQYFATK